MDKCVSDNNLLLYVANCQVPGVTGDSLGFCCLGDSGQVLLVTVGYCVT